MADHFGFGSSDNCCGAFGVKVEWRGGWVQGSAAVSEGGPHPNARCLLRPSPPHYFPKGPDALLLLEQITIRS